MKDIVSRILAESEEDWIFQGDLVKPHVEVRRGWIDNGGQSRMRIPEGFVRLDSDEITAILGFGASTMLTNDEILMFWPFNASMPPTPPANCCIWEAAGYGGWATSGPHEIFTALFGHNYSPK